MKHYLTFFVLAIFCSSVAIAQECKVPISVQLGMVSKNTTKSQEDILGKSFMNYLDRHGFTTKVHNTRVAISLRLARTNGLCEDEKGKIEAIIEFVDAVSGTVFYTTSLSKQYCGDFSDARKELAADFATPMPELDSLAENIRKCVIDAFEINTKHVAEVTHECATKGDHKSALFAILQYPPCCPSYPQIRNFIVAIFRDYMKKDHDALLDVAQKVWKNEKTEAEARFVVSLLNSDTLDRSEQKRADRILRRVAKDFPSIKLDAKEDYTKNPELKAIAVREARMIGIEYSASDEIFPEPNNFMQTNINKQTYEEFKNDYPDLKYSYYEWYMYYMDFYGMDYTYETDYYSYDKEYLWHEYRTMNAR